MSPEHPPAAPGLRPLPPLDHHLNESTVAAALARAATAAKHPNAQIPLPDDGTPSQPPDPGEPPATPPSAQPARPSSWLPPVTTTTALPPATNLLPALLPRQYGIPEPDTAVLPPVTAASASAGADTVRLPAAIAGPTDAFGLTESERQGRHAAPDATTSAGRTIPRPVIFAGALVTAVALAMLLLIPALGGDSSGPAGSQEPSPVAATPTAASLSPVPSASPTPSVASPSAATGGYHSTRRTSPRTEASDDTDTGSYDDSGTDDYGDDYSDDGDSGDYSDSGNYGHDHSDNSGASDNSGSSDSSGSGTNWWSWLSWLLPFP